MIKQAPTPSRILAMIVFALSCFGIALFLWITFGGSIPLKAKSYRFHADFREATLLATNADVRISGVNVGKIVKITKSPPTTRLLIELDAKYAPIPKDTRAILRRKSGLGESYVELSPGNPDSGRVPDGGRLPPKQVKATVELDELIREFDEPTRRAMQRFVTGLSVTLEGRGPDVNYALGNLEPLAGDTDDLLGSLDRQRSAVRVLVRDTGFVLESLGKRQGELSGLVRAGERVLSTTARRNRELQETVHILPVTLRELRPTFREIETFSNEARPVLAALRPAGRSLGGALVDARALSPQVRGLFGDLDRVIRVGRRAVPAATRTVRAARPLFQTLSFSLRDTLPVVDYLGLYKHEIAAQLANVGAANEAVASTGGPARHYLRVVIPFVSEGLAVNARRFGTNRHNPYFNPRALDKLAGGLEAFDCRNTGNGGPPSAAPPCKLQSPLSFRGRSTAFPQLKRDPR